MTKLRKCCISLSLCLGAGASIGVARADDCNTNGVPDQDDVVETLQPAGNWASTPNLAFPDLVETTDTISIAASTSFDDLDVDLQVTHIFIGDCQFWLDKAGTSVGLLSSNTTNGTQNCDVLLDDEAAGPAPIDAPLLGTFQPLQPLALFDSDGDQAGAWTMHCLDTFSGSGTGVLNQWSLHFARLEPNSHDCDSNGTPDECEMPDCNTNGVGDVCDVGVGTSQDCNTNGVPDECELADCDTNGVADVCDLGAGSAQDCNTNGVPDLCDVAATTSGDCNTNDAPDECDLAQDCNSNGIPDECDLSPANDWTSTPDRIFPDNVNTIETIHVAAGGAFDDLNVGLVVTHPFMGDTQYALVRDGTTLSLMFHKGGSTDNADVLLDDEASEPPPTFEDLLGTFQPEQPLSTFEDGGAAAGLWALHCLDTYTGSGTGVLNQWSLQFSGPQYAAIDCNADGIPDECQDCNTNGIGDGCEISSAVIDQSSDVYLAAPSHDLSDCGLADDSQKLWDDLAAPSSAILGAGIARFVPGWLGFGSVPFLVEIADVPGGAEAGGTVILSTTGIGRADGSGIVDFDFAGAVLPPGTWWIAVQATSGGCDYGLALWYRSNYETPNGSEHYWHNPGGGLGFGTDPIPYSTLYGDAADLAVTLHVTRDCNGNGVLDECDIAQGGSGDCNTNGLPDDCETGSGDCDTNGVTDLCDPDFADCNGNTIKDACDIAAGTSPDCNANSVSDECEDADCNTNGAADVCETFSGTSDDCDTNGIPDECDGDCNTNGVGDACDVAAGETDCNTNDVPDACDVVDCNTNSIPDECDLANGESPDCNTNAAPDACDGDCNTNGLADICDIASGQSEDCNGNGEADECEGGCNTNGVPDACDGDCNTNGLADVCDIDAGSSADCNTDTTPDECDVRLIVTTNSHHSVPYLTFPDLVETTDSIVLTGNAPFSDVDVELIVVHDWIGQTQYWLDRDGTTAYLMMNEGSQSDDAWIIFDDEAAGPPPWYGPFFGDAFQPATPLSVFDSQPEQAGTWTLHCLDTEADGLTGLLVSWSLHFTHTASGESPDCDSNGIPDECAPDCDSNGVPDACDLDCNTNGHADTCDIASGSSSECNTDGVPDECEAATLTAYTSSANIPFPDLVETTDAITITDGAPFTDLNVELFALHDFFMGDTQFWLDRDGTTAFLMMNQGLTQESAHVLFDDEADLLPTGYVLMGTFLPATPLSTFDQNPDQAGTWTIHCLDTYPGDGTGLLYSWSLHFGFATSGPSVDCSSNAVPDECEPDCDTNGVPDSCESDCNTNGLHDLCEIDEGDAEDCNTNAAPDECDLDVQTMQIAYEQIPILEFPDLIEVTDSITLTGSAPFSDVNVGLQALHQHMGDTQYWIDRGGTTVNLMMNVGQSGASVNASILFDDEASGPPPYYDPLFGTFTPAQPLSAFDANPDQAGTWTIHCLDTFSGAGTGILYSWSLHFSVVDSASPDCNSNGAPDECDVADGGSADSDADGIPDECSAVPCPTCAGDANGDGLVDGDDVTAFVECLIGGATCTCTDVDGDGQPANTDPADDVAALVTMLLEQTDPACP